MKLSDFIDDENKPEYETRNNSMDFITEPARARETSDPSAVWGSYTIDLEYVKNYLKIEHDYDDQIIQELVEAAIEEAKIRTNRNYLYVPKAITLSILKIVAFWYENRGEMNLIPVEAANILRLHYKTPGL